MHSIKQRECENIILWENAWAYKRSNERMEENAANNFINSNLVIKTRRMRQVGICHIRRGVNEPRILVGKPDWGKPKTEDIIKIALKEIVYKSADYVHLAQVYHVVSSIQAA
jgi:hypothetical protein